MPACTAYNVTGERCELARGHGGDHQGHSRGGRVRRLATWKRRAPAQRQRAAASMSHDDAIQIVASAIKATGALTASDFAEIGAALETRRRWYTAGRARRDRGAARIAQLDATIARVTALRDGAR